jgi:transcriptional regulator with XRE-family HTH domain
MKIKELRESRGILQTELASYLGIARNTLSQYETGKRSPDLDTLQKIADFFDVSIDFILGRSEKIDLEVVAFHKNTPGDFTKEEKEEIDNFIQYILSKRDKE